MILNEDERLEDLMIDGLKIIQNVNLYRFSSDAVILSRFAPETHGKVADFCAGSGIVGLHYYALHNFVEVDEFELQTSLADMCARSIEYNGLQGKIRCYNVAVQDISSEFDGKYSLILCNPPYKKKNSGENNQSDHLSLCRHEIAVTLEEIISVSAKKLRHGGRLCLCQRAERLSDAIVYMRKYGLEPCRLQMVTAGNDEKPYLFLIEGAKGVKPQLRILPNYKN